MATVSRIAVIIIVVRGIASRSDMIKRELFQPVWPPFMCTVVLQLKYRPLIFIHCRYHHNQGTWYCNAITWTEPYWSWTYGHDPRGKRISKGNMHLLFSWLSFIALNVFFHVIFPLDISNQLWRSMPMEVELLISQNFWRWWHARWRIPIQKKKS